MNTLIDSLYDCSTKDSCKSTVILLSYRTLLRDHPDNDIIRNNCLDYINRIKNRAVRKGPDHDKWCDTIITILEDAISGKFYEVNALLPLDKQADIRAYNGEFKELILFCLIIIF